jgi:serine/threonine protein kinase
MVRAPAFECTYCTASVVFSMEGGELFNRIRQRHEKPYTEREAAQIILMIAKAVGHLHHMDVVRSFAIGAIIVMPVCLSSLGAS